MSEKSYSNTLILDENGLNRLIKLIKTYPIAGEGTGIRLIPYNGYKEITLEDQDAFDEALLEYTKLYVYNSYTKSYQESEFEEGITQYYWHDDNVELDSIQIQNAIKIESTLDLGGDEAINNPACLKITDESIPSGDNRVKYVQVGSLLDFYTGTEDDLPIAVSDKLNELPGQANPDGSFVLSENNASKVTIVKIRGFENGKISVSDDGDAERYTTVEDDVTNDPATGIPTDGDYSTLQLGGSITTRGGIAAAKSIKGYKLYGAVFNDYAEYRQSEETKPGLCVIENGDGTLSLSNDRLLGGANIISDTYGFSIGKTEKAQVAMAVCGRVLAYPLENKIFFSPGDAVCSGPNGTVSKMTREEIKEWPDRIVGYVSEIPTYKTWGSDNIEVDGRIWIKIK